MGLESLALVGIGGADKGKNGWYRQMLSRVQGDPSDWT
jgi:hypothetical protein